MNERILVVDDSIVARNSLAKLLTENGFIVDKAIDGSTALELILKCKPECIVLDLLMPGMNGMEMLDKLQEKNIKIPVVIHSADIQESTKKQCFQLGAKAFINKPANKDVLIHTINNVLKNRRANSC